VKLLVFSLTKFKIFLTGGKYVLKSTILIRIFTEVIYFRQNCAGQKIHGR